MGFTRPTEVAPLRPAHATYRLLLVFAVTILVPGLVLGFLGLRALLQERQLAEQQVREQLAVIAESTGRQLELDLRDWQQAAEQIALMGPTDPARWPDRVRLAVTEPGGAVLLAGSQARPDVLPAGQLLYAMSPVPRTSPAEPPSPLVTRAETLELREGQHEAAIALYRGRWTRPGPQSGRPFCTGSGERSRRPTCWRTQPERFGCSNRNPRFGSGPCRQISWR